MMSLAFNFAIFGSSLVSSLTVTLKLPTHSFVDVPVTVSNTEIEVTPTFKGEITR